MASLANVPYILGPPNTHHKPHNNINNNNNFKSLCHRFPFHRNIWWVSATTVTPKRNSSTITCFAANKPSSSTEIRFSLIFVFTEFKFGSYSHGCLCLLESQNLMEYSLFFLWCMIEYGYFSV